MFCLFVSLTNNVTVLLYTFVLQSKVMTLKTNNGKAFSKTIINKKIKRINMKKQILVIALTLSVLVTASTTYASDKKVADKNYTVHSLVDGYKTVSAFDKKGKIIYSIQYYPAASLAKNIMDVVRNNFGNCYISGMEKINQPGQNEVWVVHMENTSSVKTVYVSNGEVSVANDFSKI